MSVETDSILNALRDATTGTPYGGRLFLVGGFVRDKAMGLPSAKDDIDIVLEGDALALAQFLWERGVAQFPPVVFPRFGTAMIVVQGRDVELVTARVESYAPDSRRPDHVEPGTLADDARRRDFTINTLLENLHTGEITDPLGAAYADLDAKILRTPTDPALTFADDPLRMLRAVRFAARFGFAIAPETWAGIRANAARLSIVSAERINEEFGKTLLTPRAPLGMRLLQDSGLLAHFAPELLEMVGVTQNAFHVHDVWTHTLVVLDSLPAAAPLVLRLAALLHDTGKPRTRTVDAEGHVHFYGHQDVSAQIARALMLRLKFSNDEIAAVTRLVAEHMRIGEYNPSWTDSAVRRLIRDLGDCLSELFTLHAADVAGLSRDHQDISRARELHARVEAIQAHQDIAALTSPLSGQEIMRLLDLKPGKRVGEIKDYLTNEVVEGRLAPDDKEAAARLARDVWFWEIMESSDHKLQSLAEKLEALSQDGLRRFQQYYEAAKEKVNPGIPGAMIGVGEPDQECSEDGGDDFADWVVGQGHRFYEQVRTQPSRINQHLALFSMRERGEESAGTEWDVAVVDEAYRGYQSPGLIAYGIYQWRFGRSLLDDLDAAKDD